MTPRRRVVITGMGVVSPLGCDLGMFWHLLSAGESGITPITHFDTSPFQSSLAGEVNDFDPTDFIHPKKISSYGPCLPVRRRFSPYGRPGCTA